MGFNVAERIGQLRAIEAKIKMEEEKFEEAMKRYREFAAKARHQILDYLNTTDQDSAATLQGTAYKIRSSTYSVVDRDAWRNFVIEGERWGMNSWSVAKVETEKWIVDNKQLPPGVERSAVVKLGVKAPPKSRVKKAKDEETLSEAEWAEAMKMADEMSALDAVAANSGE